MKGTPSDAAVDAFLAKLDASFPPGVAALVTTSPPPTSFQVGSDATPICVGLGRLIDNIQALPKVFPGLTLPIDTALADALRCTDALPALRAAKRWTWMPEDARADLSDGALSQSRLAAGQTNGALLSPLTFSSDVAEGEALFAFGTTIEAARAALAKGTSTPIASRIAASEAKTHEALGAATLPDPALGARVVDVARRSLANIYVARDAGTGAIVASVSRQPPYFIDWPRDGSFFQHALDVAGLYPWVTQRAEWYATIQRQESVPKNPLITPLTTTDPDTGDEEFPAFAWEMNYYADGTIGGNIRFEIDNTALHVWSTVAHAAYLEGDARATFLRDVWPSTRAALNLLVRWRDPKTALPWPANEDDHFELTSTLHGATTVYAALIAGARAAHALGEEVDAQTYLGRALELKKAMLDAYFDSKTGLFRDTPQIGTEYIPGTTGTGSTAWLAWPARVLDDGDPRLEAQLSADLAAVMKDIRGESEGGAYVMKNVISAALLGKVGGSRDVATDAVKRLADMATPDTMHFGEVFVTLHTPGKSPTFSQRVAQPHVWEGTLFYLSAVALSAPQRFDAQLAALPLPEAPNRHLLFDGDCGCRIGGGGDEAASAAFALAGLSLVFTLGRRARRLRAARRSTVPSRTGPTGTRPAAAARTS